MLGLISIIVNGCDNTVFSAKQGNRCCIGGEMPSSIKNPTLLTPLTIIGVIQIQLLI